jgi:hypothetical protein
MSKYTYDQVVQWYLDARKEIDRIDAQADKAKQIHKQRMATCEAWISEQAKQDGLTTVPTKHGTAYWSTHHTATVSSRDLFLDYVQKMNAWDLLETRASKKAVQSLVDATGLPPPGVNYSTYEKLVIRTKE